MSVRCSTYVWDHSETKGSDRLILLAIADACNDDGQWSPGVTRLADKAKLSERQTQRCLSNLKKMDEIDILYNKGIKTSSGFTNHYIMIGYLRWRQGVSPTSPLPEKGVSPTSPLPEEGVSPTSPLENQGVTSTSPQGVTPTSPNTSEEPSVKNILPNAAQRSASEPTDSVKANASASEPVVTTSPPPPSKTKARATRRTKLVPPNPLFNDLKAAYIAAIELAEPGVTHNHGQIGKGIKELVAAGWTPAMVTEGVKLLKEDPFWREKHLSVQTLGQQGPAKLNGHGPKPTGMWVKPTKPEFDKWLQETYGVSNLQVAAQYDKQRAAAIEMEYQLL